MAERTRRGQIAMFLLLPAVVGAVIVLGALLVRATLQVERLRQQSVLEATISLANEKVDRLDHLVIEQDNALAAEVNVNEPGQVGRRWLPIVVRETPTVRAVLVIDLANPEHEVLGFASRAPGPEDESFRRLVVLKMIGDFDLRQTPESELRHLHKSYGSQSYLVSYWQRMWQGRRYLVIAWHDVPRLVHEVFPRLYADASGKSRVSVVDEEGRPVFGTMPRSKDFTVGRPFPTTLYGWRLYVALTAADELGARVERRRLLELGMMITACVVIILGMVFFVIAVETERRLSMQKSEFVANVSHELKTPLSLVRMFAELLLSNRVPSEEKRKQYLQIILQESERLTALIENVLDFARVERGKASFDFTLGNASEVASRAVDVIRHRAEREGMQVHLVTPSVLPPVRLDARALELALVNLLDNAIKYANSGKLITVKVEGQKDTVEISIADSGPGIPSEEQRRIFDRFVRGKAAREARVRGSGIGLSLVKHIAKSHGGYVHLMSQLGVGTTFSIGLPVVNESVPPSVVLSEEEAEEEAAPHAPVTPPG